MVFHYTNFVFETNAWWLRRVRPVWGTALGIWLYAIMYRYYFFGKIQAYWQTTIPDEEWQRRAQENKRDWGYNAIYRPTLARSKKRQLMEALGSDYKFADTYAERFMIETRTLEQIYEEEDNYDE